MVYWLTAIFQTMTVTGKPTMLSRRTRTVYQTANPVFEERWKFTAPHYRARVSVGVVGWLFMARMFT